MTAVIRPSSIDEDRLERSRRVGWIDLDALSSSNALVVGAGALGNEVVKNLILSGLRDITLIDMDRVVVSNLNRCTFFRLEDTSGSKYKAEILAERALELDPDVIIEPLVCRVQDAGSGIFQKADVVFGCLDNLAARLHVNSHAYHYGVPYIDGGTLGTSGKVQVVIPPRTPCLQCAINRTHYRILESRFSCTGNDVSFYEPKLAAEITTTSVIAAIQVREALKLLSGSCDRCLRHVFYYNGMTNAGQELELSLDPDCPLHDPP